MPKLQVFVACEKIVIDEEKRKAVSLICLLETLTATPQKEGEPIPADEVSPTTWQAFILWRPDEGDSPNTDYEQRVTLMGPSGKIYLDGKITAFRGSAGRRQLVNINGFPVGEAGIYNLILSLREVDAAEWIEVGRYPIRLIHATQEPRATDSEGMI